MTTDELRAAAERLRMPSAGGYPWPCDMHEQPAQRSADLATLARAYLADHPADDAEPVSREWAEAVAPGGLVPGGYWSLPIEVRPWTLRVNGEEVVADPTRGDVRRLCAAIRIQLKENPNA